MDEDLEAMDRAALVAEVVRLRAALREHEAHYAPLEHQAPEEPLFGAEYDA